jgi:hypothetical protein
MRDGWSPHFLPNETLLWEGSPVPGFHQQGKAVFMMAFGLPSLVIGVAVFLSGLYRITLSDSLSDTGLAIFFAAFGVPFGAIGAFCFFGPWFEARTMSRHVRYALTGRAGYVARSGPFPSLKVYPILPYTAPELEPGPRASTVWLHAQLERDSDGDLETVKAGFENIAEGEKVFHLIRNLQGKTDD